MRATVLSMRRCCGCWIATGSASSCIALLREELRNLAPLGELQAAHAAVLERLFADWERHWRECRECLPEVIPAVQHLREKSESSRAELMIFQGIRTGRRIGELEIALRIVQHWRGRQQLTAPPENRGFYRSGVYVLVRCA
jgi:hypothetical protein